MKSRLKTSVKAVTVACLLFLLNFGFAQTEEKSLEQNFVDPPDSAKPRTWWHWTGGNVTKEGITKDLEWMKRAGIGGMQLADVSFGGGQTVEPKLDFGSDAWLDAVRHAAFEAQRLGLEMAIFSSPGWSETGGPWVTPQQAMKKYVWSTIALEGPQEFVGTLPHPPSNNGPYQNSGRQRPDDRTLYGDSAVVAYRTPPAVVNVLELKPTITTSSGDINAAALLDDDMNSAVVVRPAEDEQTAWLQFEFEEPFTARAITLSGPAGIPVGSVLAGDDGVHFQPIVALPGTQLYRQGNVRTFAFGAVTAKFFRIEMTGAPLRPDATMNQVPPAPAREYVFSQILLHSEGYVNRWEEKAGFKHLFEYDSVPTPDVGIEAAVQSSDVIDLTDKMKADGTLQWDVPAGHWTVLRLGYSLTGATNRPATPAGSGYEVDKLNPEHVEAYFHGYMDPIAEALGPLYGKSLQYMLIDSWEAGTQNWTEIMIPEFRKRRGYDPAPYLPALTGLVVQNANVSDRFLWDFRRTLADMFAENHYGVLTRLLEKDGLGTYGEAAGVSLEIPEDTLLNKRYVSIPMGEFWVGKMHPPLMYYQDVRGAASAAHIYDKPIVAAESFTGGGYEAPYTLKKAVDYWFAQGINRIVFHTSAHQPLDTKPGNTMVGTHIHRNITWAEQAEPFMQYLARNSYMLQQGAFVADLVYLLNEGAPSTPPIWGAGTTPKPPDGYDFDYINADALIHRLSVDENGRLVLPNGAGYRILILPEVDTMTLPVLEKIHKLVEGGAVVIGPRPQQSPSLTGYPDADKKIKALANDLWGDLDGVSRNKHFFGKGTVIWGLPLKDVLDSLNIEKDLEYAGPLDADIAWIHRRAEDVDIYYVSNQTDQALGLDVWFRINGRQAQLWHPDNGSIEPASFRIADSRTTVPLHLTPRQSLFVVFRESTSQTSRTVTQPAEETMAAVEGPWTVTFEPKLGAPEKIKMTQLQSWTENPDNGVKYYSGTAAYTTTLQAPQSWFDANGRLILDLGNVRDIAEVLVNGHPVATLWKPPYCADVTQSLHPGENKLEIKVTNQWSNRLAGDRDLPRDERVLTRGNARGGFAGFGAVLNPSGLMGPVTIKAIHPIQE